MERHTLSKPTFLRGVQCNKSLYLYKHHYNQRDLLSPIQEAVFRRGTSVGLLAWELFPGGADASPPNHFQYGKSVEKTDRLIQEGHTCIYEAAFQYRKVLSALDILVREADGWVAWEVKSSTSVSDVYILDAALQYYVITRSGLPLKDIKILYLNPKYLRKGPLDLSMLFTARSVLEEARELEQAVEVHIKEFKEVIQQKRCPQADIGPHCFTPYTCDFMGVCWQNIPEPSVFDIKQLSRDKKFELYRGGVIEFPDVPANAQLSEKQWRQIRTHLNGEIHLEKDRIEEYLNSFVYPLYFLDFESFQPAVPLFDDTKPYQQVTFLYSLHVMEGDHRLDHRDFIALPCTDPRPAFLEHLAGDLGDSGSIVVYNRTFEVGRLKEMAAAFPSYGESIGKMITRVVDLMVPFQKQYFYTKEMHGSYSIKKVLPSLVDDLDYAGLNIQEGSMASIVYEGLWNEDNSTIVEEQCNDLRDYCRTDTLAMVRIYEKLLDLIKEG